MCMAFGVERLDDVATKLEDVLEMQPPQGSRTGAQAEEAKSIADSLPKTVSRGASQEVVLTGDGSTSTCFRSSAAGRRPAPFITLPAVITKDPPAFATSACTGCRRSTRARRTCMADPQGRTRGLCHRRRPRALRSTWIRHAYSAARRCRAHRRVHARRLPARRAGQLVKARPSTSVPARRDHPGRHDREGRGRDGSPFGDHTGYYRQSRLVFGSRRSRCGATPSIVDRRRQAGADAPGSAGDRADLPAGDQDDGAEIVDYDCRREAFRNCVIVSIRKSFPGRAQGDAPSGG